MLWEAAIADGKAMVDATAEERGEWRWKVGVDIGNGWNAEDARRMASQLAPLPAHDLLIAPYLPPEPDAGPLDCLWARRGVIPFHSRDELDRLLDWCQAPDDGPARTRVQIVHGVGGCGKTHLAAELCHRLDAKGWHTGFLARHASRAGMAWLGGVVSPLLVVVDYAEATKSTDVVNLLREVWGRAGPTRVVLTARAVGGWWDDIDDDLRSDGHASVPVTLPLPDQHPAITGVYRTAVRAIGVYLDSADGLGGTAPEIPPGRWTTLDLVMLAWLAANGERDLPTSPAKLYEQILKHEHRYWRRTYQNATTLNSRTRACPVPSAHA
jgi:hypothetical protein